MVPLGAAAATTSGCPGVEGRRVVEVGDVEQRDLGAHGAAGLGGLLADAEHQVPVDRVEVAAVAGDLEFAAHDRVRRVGEVDRVEGVGLAEGHDVADVADEAHCVDAFTLPHLAHLADLDEVFAGVSRQDGHDGLTLVPEPPWTTQGGGDPQVPGVLGHRELVQDVSRHGPRTHVHRGSRVTHPELVDRGGVVPVHLLPGGLVVHRVDVTGGGHVEVPAARVDGLAVGQHRGRVGGNHGGGQVDGDHRQRREAGELGGVRHPVAVDEKAVGEGAVCGFVDVRRQPVGDHGLGDDLPVELGGAFLAGRVLRIDERQLLGAAGEHHPGGTVDDAGAHVAALDREGVGDAQVGRVGEVDLDQGGERLVVAGGHEAADGGVSGTGTAVLSHPALRLGQHEEAVTVEQHLGAPVAGQFDRVGEDGGPARDVDVVQPLVLDDEDPVAVGLDEVGLVDPEFLDVGAGEVDAGLQARRAAIRLCRNRV